MHGRPGAGSKSRKGYLLDLEPEAALLTILIQLCQTPASCSASRSSKSRKGRTPMASPRVNITPMTQMLHASWPAAGRYWNPWDSSFVSGAAAL